MTSFFIINNIYLILSLYRNSNVLIFNTTKLIIRLTISFIYYKYKFLIKFTAKFYWVSLGAIFFFCIDCLCVWLHSCSFVIELTSFIYMCVCFLSLYATFFLLLTYTNNDKIMRSLLLFYSIFRTILFRPFSVFLWRSSDIKTSPFFSSLHHVYRALSLAPEEGQGRFTDCMGHCAGKVKHCSSQRPQHQDRASLWMKYYTRPVLIKSASTQNYALHIKNNVQYSKDNSLGLKTRLLKHIIFQVFSTELAQDPW